MKVYKITSSSDFNDLIAEMMGQTEVTKYTENEKEIKAHLDMLKDTHNRKGLKLRLLLVAVGILIAAILAI